MNRQIRGLGISLIVLFLALLLRISDRQAQAVSA